MSVVASPSDGSDRNRFLGRDQFEPDSMDDGRGGDARVSARPGLPCPKSESSNESSPRSLNESALLKRYYMHSENARAFVEHHDIRHIGFLTLTFPEKVFDRKEAERRLNSLLSGFLRRRYGKDALFIVRECHKDRSFHFHMLVVLPFVIHTPLNLEVFRSKRWNKADRLLRGEWALLRRKLRLYGFGRHRLEPVFTNARGICSYICKYITKAVSEPGSRSAGGCLVRGPKALKRVSSKFSWVKARPWRQKLSAFAGALCVYGLVVNDISGFKEHLGKSWAYHYRDSIQMLDAGDNPGPLDPHTLAREAYFDLAPKYPDRRSPAPASPPPILPPKVQIPRTVEMWSLQSREGREWANARAVTHAGRIRTPGNP